MKKLTIILLIISIFNINVKAQETDMETYPKFTFGLEWGYVASFHTLYHFDYSAPDDFRIDEYGRGAGYRSNADVYVNAGWNINHLWNLSLYIGYAGVGEYHSVMPISIRGTRFFGENPLADRWFAFVDVGSGICLKTPLQEIAAGKIGGGYQMSLSRDTKLNFLFSARTTYTHPNIYMDDIRIPMDRTNKNNALVSALSVGLALLF